MHIHVALTEDIINQCLTLHYHDQPAGKRLRQRLILIPLLLMGIAAYLIITELRQPQVGQNFYMAILYICFAFVYYFFMKNRMMRAGKKLLKNLGENATFDMEVNEGELITTTRSGSFTNDWKGFTGGLLGKENVLLYQANNSFSMFHVTFFQEGNFEKFKQLVREKVKPVLEV